MAFARAGHMIPAAYYTTGGRLWPAVFNAEGVMPVFFETVPGK